MNPSPAALAVRIACSGTPSDEVVAALDALIAVQPDASDLRFAHAVALDDLGRAAAARDAYRALLEHDPVHACALTNLAVLELIAGRFGPARELAQRAAAADPGSAAGALNLGLTCAALGDGPAAIAAYERALALDATFPQAHLALAAICEQRGEGVAAARHRSAAFARPIVDAAPRRGTERLDLLVLTSAAGGNLVTTLLFDERVHVTTLVVESAGAAPLPHHDLLLNAIADADRAPAALELAAALARRSAAPVLNAPEAVARTGRAEVAARLRDVPGVRTPRIELLPRAAVTSASLAARGYGYPLLLRAPGYHAGEYFRRVRSAADVAATVAALPGADLYAIEFLATTDAAGYSRKYRMLFVGTALLPVHLAIGRRWKLHAFSAGMGERPEHRAEEARFLADPAATLGEGALAALVRVRDALGVDYGGIDFTLGPGGEVVCFEANATMAIYLPVEETFAYRRPAVERVRAAFGALLAARAG